MIAFRGMSESQAAMRTALRVLTAILDEAEPALSDVEELRRLSPNDADDPVDVLACKVVHNALGERAKARGTG